MCFVLFTKCTDLVFKETGGCCQIFLSCYLVLSDKQVDATWDQADDSCQTGFVKVPQAQLENGVL